MNKVQWAENLLRDEFFQEMMNELRTAELNKFATSDYGDLQARETAYMRLRTLELVETYLEGLAANKLIEEKRLKIL
jgi:hypothetical protein